MPTPSEYHVGVVDLFAIVLPGAITTAILEPPLSPLVFGPLVSAPTTEPAKWVAFLVVSYFLGHLIFLAGSYIDRPYNFVREHLRPYTNESAFQRAMSIRNELIPEGDRQALNTFQWARSVLITGYPAAAQDVARLEADSKFFRSLLVVCLVAAMTFALTHRGLDALAAAALTIPCFARYYERRLKSTTQAYIHLVTLYRLGLFPKSPASGAS